jgi:hypothetical protein
MAGYGNKRMSMQLNFEYLFRRVLTDWPDELDLSVLERATPDLGRYAVKGLGTLSDDIEAKYIGKENEIIWRDLHSAMYEVIHAAAKTVLEIKVHSIRPEAVRLVFEKRLNRSAAATTLNWLPEDYALAEAYFAQNPPTETT